MALKVLSEKLAGNPDPLSRFERETRTVASLSHPNILTLLTSERNGGQHGLRGKELLEGDGLSSAHARRIVHRDAHVVFLLPPE